MKNEIVSYFLGEEPTKKIGGNLMKTKMKKLMKDQKGMTLIELLAVIVIIAIIALIAIPAIGNIINKSHDKAILSDASQVISSAKIAISDGSCADATSEITATDGTKSTVKNVTCNKAALDDKIDGITLDNNDKVVMTKDSNGKSIYTITYKAFEGFKTDKFKSSTDATNGIGADNVITDAKLAVLMGNK